MSMVAPGDLPIGSGSVLGPRRVGVGASTSSSPCPRSCPGPRLGLGRFQVPRHTVWWLALLATSPKLSV